MCVRRDAAMRTTEDGEDEEIGSDTTVGYVMKSGKHTRSTHKKLKERSTHTRKAMAGIALSIDE